MNVSIENDHHVRYYLDVKTIIMDSCIIEIIHNNGVKEKIIREENTKIITN